MRDVVEAIDAIRAHAPSRADFDRDELIRVYCLHHLVVIGEAVSRISEPLRERHPSVPWRRIVDMRNAVLHGYFQVEWDEVWAAVERDLEPLRRQAEAILAAETALPRKSRS